MGGYGSGRRGWHEKVEDYRRLDVLRLYQEDCLRPSLYFNWFWKVGEETTADINIETHDDYIELKFHCGRRGEQKEYVEQIVRLEWTSCTLGGRQPWFHCPNCGRRVRMLYGGRRFYCRTCHQLVYASQSEGRADRAFRRACKLRTRLGGEPGIQQFIFKPKRMRWVTFDRMLAEIKAKEGISLAMAARRLGLLSSSDELKSRYDFF